MQSCDVELHGILGLTHNKIAQDKKIFFTELQTETRFGS